MTRQNYLEKTPCPSSRRGSIIPNWDIPLTEIHSNNRNRLSKQIPARVARGVCLSAVGNADDNLGVAMGQLELPN